MAKLGAALDEVYRVFRSCCENFGLVCNFTAVNMTMDMRGSERDATDWDKRAPYDKGSYDSADRQRYRENLGKISPTDANGIKILITGMPITSVGKNAGGWTIDGGILLNVYTQDRGATKTGLAHELGHYGGYTFTYFNSDPKVNRIETKLDVPDNPKDVPNGPKNVMFGSDLVNGPVRNPDRCYCEGVSKLVKD